MDKNKIQRMRNLVTGDYGSKSRVQTGYKKYKSKKQEGDVWEENGRTWTIKNGIKQNVRKLDKARAAARIPISCPSCGGAMNKSQHKFMYMRYKHCLHCQSRSEIEMRHSGTYDNWLVENVKKNFKSWKAEKKIEFEDYLRNINSKHFITEAGEIEDWSEMTDIAKQDMKQKFEEFMETESNNIEEMVNKKKENNQ